MNTIKAHSKEAEGLAASMRFSSDPVLQYAFACVVDVETEHVLVVEDRLHPGNFSLPGRLVNVGEDKIEVLRMMVKITSGMELSIEDFLFYGSAIFGLSSEGLSTTNIYFAVVKDLHRTVEEIETGRRPCHVEMWSLNKCAQSENFQSQARPFMYILRNALEHRKRLKNPEPLSDQPLSPTEEAADPLRFPQRTSP